MASDTSASSVESKNTPHPGVLSRPLLWLLLTVGFALLSMALRNHYGHPLDKYYGEWTNQAGEMLTVEGSPANSNTILAHFRNDLDGLGTEQLTWGGTIEDHLRGPSSRNPAEIIRIFELYPFEELLVQIGVRTNDPEHSGKTLKSKPGFKRSKPAPRPPWIFPFVAAVACAGLSCFLVIKQQFGKSATLSSTSLVTSDSQRKGDIVVSRPSSGLQVWDEASITAQLKQLRDEKPSLIPHFVESIKERFIVRQDDRTAQARLRFMQSQIEQLRLAKDFQQLTQDLEILRYEREKRIKALELETQKLDFERQSLTSRQQLESLREQKKLELEIAQLDKQIEEIKTPPKPELKPTPEQERAQRKAAVETKIANLRKEQAEAVNAIPESLAEQRRKVSNMYADAIEREMENLRKIL